MTQIAADGADASSWPGSRPVARIVDEHGDAVMARMAVDSEESHLTEDDRSAYRPADHSRTIRKGRVIANSSENRWSTGAERCPSERHLNLQNSQTE
jgi:hypothetical protein